MTVMMDHDNHDQDSPASASSAPKRRGRPPGSKNKKYVPVLVLQPQCPHSVPYVDEYGRTMWRKCGATDYVQVPGSRVRKIKCYVERPDGRVYNERRIIHAVCSACGNHWQPHELHNVK